MGACLRGRSALFVCLVLAGLAGGCLLRAGRGEKPTAEESGVSPLGDAAGCLVCHVTFVEEELSLQHAAAGITCSNCHGVSAGHANDEEIGRTPPDRAFRRDEVDRFCRKCHPAHNVPAAKVVAVWEKRRRGKRLPVCTDCHGRHRISEAAGTPEVVPEAAPERRQEESGEVSPPGSCDSKKEETHDRDRDAR